MDARLRVLLASQNVGLSLEEVASSFVYDEAKALAGIGLEVHVARWAPAPQPLIISEGVYFHSPAVRAPEGVWPFWRYPPLSLLRGPRALFMEWGYSSYLRRLHRALRPSVVHAHFAWPEGFCVYLSGARPYVITLHGYDVLTEPSSRYGIRLSKRFDLLVRRTLEDACAVIVASRALFSEAAKIVSPAKIHLIPRGVDLNRFNPKVSGDVVKRELGLEDKFVVFTARGHVPQYGLVYLILAAKILKERGYRDVAFVIGGTGPLLGYHRELARRLNLDNVFFVGKIPRSKMPYYFAAADVVVVPSLQESWGLVVTEALASGKPVVGSRVGGIPDQIIDGVNGFLVPPRDPKAIAERIAWLVDNPGEAKKMGMRGRAMAEKRFDIEKMVRKIAQIYRKCSEF